MNQIKKLLTISLLLVNAAQVKSQSTSTSPYSRFGIGEIQSTPFAKSKSMAGLSSAIRNSYELNPMNPASYTSIEQTAFEVGGFVGFMKQSNAVASQTNNNASLTYLAVAFPLAEKWGGSFGLLPFSGLGYESTVLTTESMGTVKNIFEGSGGLNQFYIGTAYSPFKNISIGANVSYLFGNLSETKSKEFHDTLLYYNIRQQHSTFIGDFHAKVGIQYSKALKDDKRLTLGFTAALQNELNAGKTTLSERYRYISPGNATIIDTPQNTPDVKGTILLPASYNLGVVFSKENKWMFGAELAMSDWTSFRNFGADPKLQQRMEIGLGGSYTPDYNVVGNYFKRMEYRLGFNYVQSGIRIQNEDINEMSVTAGLGLPLPRSQSRINLGLELGQRGTISGNLIKEEYLMVYFGFSFSDKWFVKRKYD